MAHGLHIVSVLSEYATPKVEFVAFPHFSHFWGIRRERESLNHAIDFSFGGEQNAALCSPPVE
jgi:hypothetical protein